MKVLMVMQHVNFFRNLDTVVRELHARGHQVALLHGTQMDDPRVRAKLARKKEKMAHQGRGIEIAQSEIPDVVVGYRPEPVEKQHLRLRSGRALMNRAIYLRKGHPSPDRVTEGLEGKLQPKTRWLVQRRAVRWLLGRRFVLPLWRRIEARSKPSPTVVAAIERHRPHVVLVSPTVWPKNSVEADYIHAARWLEVPTVGYLNSWDNLTSKGTVHVLPDRYIVWNQALADEAVEIHDIPRDLIRVTGAPHIDRFFEMKPTVEHAAVCRQMGLPEDRPYVIYLCSSRTLIASEVELVERLAEAIALHEDGEPPTLVVRPHPVNPDPWTGFSHPGVVVYPERGDHADTTESWQDYYNQLSHASSFFGLNTTAFLEAVVVDRPCLTIVSDEFHAQQGFTGHFRHLIEADFLEVCADDDEVGERVARILRGVDEKAEGRRAFVQSFIRPCGLDRAATLEVVEAIEQAVDPSAVVAEASAPLPTARSAPAPERKSTRIDGSRGPVRHAPSAVAIAGAASSMPMSRPFFSIAIPTKNRPERVRDAVRSLVEQTFGDLEIIVCDNSDEAESAQTAAVVGEFDDPRIRYIRTSGKLSMPDNWEAAIADARGEFVGVLTDRSIFKREALEVVNADIENTGPKVVSWFNDLYGRDPSGTRFKRRPATFSRHELSSSEVLDYFVHGYPKYTPKIIPKLMTSVCHRSVLDAIRSSGAGRVCPPVAPDFTSGFLMLAHSDWVLMMDESLYVSVGTGNGADFRRKGELAERFVQDLGMTWDELVGLMPSDACFAHALILNDLMRVRELVPGRLGDVEVDRAQYYLGCLNDYMKTARHGVTRDEDLEALLTQLDQDAPDVQRTVKSKRLYTQVVKMPANGAQLKAQASEAAEAAGPPPLAFPTVWEALAWDEANPRTPIARGFLDELPTIDDMKKARMIQPKGLGAKGRAIWAVRTEDTAESARRKARKYARAEESAEIARRKARSRARRHEQKLRKLEKKKPIRRRTRLFVRDVRNSVRLRTRLGALFGKGAAARENEVAEARLAAQNAEAAERAAQRAAQIETRRQAFALREAARRVPQQAAQRPTEAAGEVDLKTEAEAETDGSVSR